MIDRLRQLLIKRGPKSDPRPARNPRRPQLVVLQGGLANRDPRALPPSGPGGTAA
jgi:hypothetical protein